MNQKRGILGSIRRLLSSSNKSEEKDNSIVRDTGYRSEQITDAHRENVLKGTQLVCALDEKTCLKCLILDGSEEPIKFPIHEGCRCVMVPITKSWKELGVDFEKGGEETRASAIGQVPADGGVFKAYLIERAKAIEKGIKGEVLNHYLSELLPTLKERYPTEEHEFAAIKATLLPLWKGNHLSDIESVLHNLEWTSDKFEPLFKRCAELDRFDLIDRTLKRVVKEVPGGPFGPRHMGMLYRMASNSVKKFSLDKAVEYHERAVRINNKNIAVMMELGKLYRRKNRFEDAKTMFGRVLAIKPNHRDAMREISKL